MYINTSDCFLDHWRMSGWSDSEKIYYWTSTHLFGPRLTPERHVFQMFLLMEYQTWRYSNEGLANLDMSFIVLLWHPLSRYAKYNIGVVGNLRKQVYLTSYTSSLVANMLIERYAALNYQHTANRWVAKGMKPLFLHAYGRKEEHFFACMQNV